MKVDRSLGLRKFDSILMTSTFEMAIGVLISLSDTAVTGHIIGADGLSAMNIISPITGMTIFTENLIAVGTSMLYARRKGEYDDQGADSAYGMGLILSAGMGILTFILLLCFMPVYLRQMNVDADAVQNLIAENARVAQNQEEYTIRYDALVSRFETTKAEYEKTTADISARGIRRRELERFIQSVEKLPEMVTEFDEALWGSLVDHLTVNAKDDIIFTLTSGMEINA